ncbi:MAG: glycosyltransferase family 2 protein [Bacteroidales bacterium]|nr:glycosyltransferase family 2 protein [Bacteroidales bacterium]
MTAVSILVAAYNAEGTLPRCLDSLLGQSLRQVQVLCVDDCSTDGTLALLRKYAARDERVEVLQTPVNSGQAVARNLALKHVRAPLVCMVDADDWLSPDALQSAVDVFTAYPLTDSVAFTLYYNNKEGDERLHPFPDKLLSAGFLSGADAFKLSLNGWQLHGLYVTRTAINRTYPYDASCRLYSDDNTSHLHYLHSREVRCCSGIYYYRQHDGSSTRQFSPLRLDLMEANLSLLFSLRQEHVEKKVLHQFEGQRWYNFLGCYRFFLHHRRDFPASFVESLPQRFTTILHTFRPSRLPLRYRWKPGYWLLFSPRLFDWQQKAYVRWWEKGIKGMD